jgi:flagellar protein FliS
VSYDQNPYQAYADGSLFSGNPLNQVIALYQAAIDATNQAERALSARDIMGRGRAINKANAILTELLVSLDDELEALVLLYAGTTVEGARQAIGGAAG